MAIVTLEQVKTFLQIDTNTKDALITLLIPEVEAHYQDIRQREFNDDSSDEIEYPDGSAFTAAQMVGYLMTQNEKTATGMKSESVGKYSYTKEDMIKGYPKSIVGKIKRYATIK